MVTVLLAGQYQNGKSTLINCLLGGKYAVEGEVDGLHTTAYRTVYAYSPDKVRYYKVAAGGRRVLLKGGLSTTIDRKSGDVHFEAEIPSPMLKTMTLVDAPGWGAEDSDDKQAEQSLQNVDFVVYLAQARQLSKEDKNFLRLLKKKRTYFCIVLNARDRTDPQDVSLQNVCSAISGTLKQIGLDEQYVQYPAEFGLCVVNLLWAKYGKHLLDKPETQREKQQSAVVRSAWTCLGSESDALDHSELLKASGFLTWNVFLETSLRLIGKCGTVADTEIHEVVAASICNNLIKILTRK